MKIRGLLPDPVVSIGKNVVDWWPRLKAARWVWVPLAAFGITRLGIALVAYLAAPLLLDSTNPPPYHLRSEDNILLDVFGSRWDTGFYVSIAEEGYRYEGVPLPSVPFFPLLPALMRALTPITGDAVVAGLIVTNLALLVATILLYRLSAEEWGFRVAERSVWYLLIFPTSFFGSAIYSESLFLLCAIAALSLARKGLWEGAGLAGLFGALTRLVGLLIAPLLFIEWLSQWAKRSKGRNFRPFGVLATVAVPLGTLWYMAYLDRAFGDPLAFAHASAAWDRVPRSPLQLVAPLIQRPVEGWWSGLLAGHIHIDNWIDFSATILFLVFGVILLIQRRWSEGVFVTLGSLIPLSSGLLMSQRRYIWVLFPVYILLARWGANPWIDRLITTLSLIGLALFTALFANGYWVA